MRHGIAEPLSAAMSEDFDRALTAKGRKRTYRAALGLRQLVPQLNFLASSPKLRARQTAQIVAEVWGAKAPPLIEWSELLEDDLAAPFEKLRALKADTALLCGHEPMLGRAVSQLLTGSADALGIEFKKAGVCALEVDFELKNARLLWHLTPKYLRQISKKTG